MYLFLQSLQKIYINQEQICYNIKRMRGNMNKEQILSELPFWGFLNKSEQDELIKHSDIKEYKKGSLIYNNLNECLGMILPTGDLLLN